MMEKYNERGFFTNNTEQRPVDALRNFGLALKTVLVVPPHTEHTHRLMKAENIADPLPLQPSKTNIAGSVTSMLLSRLDAAEKPAIKNGRLLNMAAALIQFTDHVPSLYQIVKTPYQHVESLYDEVISRASIKGPLTFADQLDISLNQNQGNLPDSLWQLFMASRFYARRRDGQALPGVPKLNADNKLETMVNWQNSLAACTLYTPEGYQDAAGDTYYAWTHALAKFAFSQLPARPGAATKAATFMFNSGANVMQAYVNTIYKEGTGATNRDHIPAARYGNTIGQACVDVWRNEIE